MIDGKGYADARVGDPVGAGNPTLFIFLQALLLSLREGNNTNSNSLFVYSVVCSVKEIGVPTSEERP